MKRLPFLATLACGIRAGRKTETRRLGPFQSDHYTELGWSMIDHQTRGEILQATYRAFPGQGSARWAICDCPFVPGEIVGLVEPWRVAGCYDSLNGTELVKLWKTEGLKGGILYEAEDPANIENYGRRRLPRFMPDAFVKTTLRIDKIGVERLQDITEEQAIAEGMAFAPGSGSGEHNGEKGYWMGAPHPIKGTPKCFNTATQAFTSIWDYLHAKDTVKATKAGKATVPREPWASNPWVFRYCFKVTK